MRLENGGDSKPRRFAELIGIGAGDAVGRSGEPREDGIEAGIRWLCLTHDVTGRPGKLEGLLAPARVVPRVPGDDRLHHRNPAGPRAPHGRRLVPAARDRDGRLGGRGPGRRRRRHGGPPDRSAKALDGLQHRDGHPRVGRSAGAAPSEERLAAAVRAGGVPAEAPGGGRRMARRGRVLRDPAHVLRARLLGADPARRRDR